MNRQNKAAYIREAQSAAERLGLPSHGPYADMGIVDYCQRKVSDLVAKHGLPETVAELLERMAATLDVEIVEIHSEEDLANLFARIPLLREPALALVAAEFQEDTDAVTIRRRAPEEWERPYLAVINCQGWHYHRRYFTKWHELVHRLIDGEQLKFACRSSGEDEKDPGEVLVDKVAAVLAFYPDIVKPVAIDTLDVIGLGFQAADALRDSIAEEASRQASALALLLYVSRPAWFIKCAKRLNRTEARSQANSRNRLKYEPKLRVIEASPNSEAIEAGIRVHQWMRVPETSLVQLSWQTGVEQTGDEDLANWETSAGGAIGFGLVSVDTWIVDDEVFALISLNNEFDGRDDCIAAGGSEPAYS